MNQAGVAGKRVVIITGASSGIGLACAKRWAKAGYQVVLAARREKELLEVCAEIGANATPYACDVTQESECKALIDFTLAKFGRVDVMINNAGISMRALVKKLEMDVLRKVMDVNFWGTVYCTKYALPAIEASKGSIIGVSSVAGIVGLPARSGYSASKFAMQGFLQSVRLELKPSGAHVMVVCPGFTESNIRKTALTATGGQQSESPLAEDKLMSAEAVADAMFNANERRKRTLVLTSQGKLTAFLNKIAPAFLENQVLKLFQKEANSPLAIK